MTSKIREQLPSWEQAFPVFKVVARPLVAVLLLVVLILIPTVSGAIGEGAFLVSTYLHLFFYPEGPIGDHVETVFVHLAVCAFGLGITTLFVCITVWIDGENSQTAYSTTRSKVLGACVLALWCFFGGICESRFPRIKGAMRILLFSSTWTICTGASQISSTIFTMQFYPAALAAGVSLVSSLVVFPRSAQQDFTTLLVKTYSTQRAILGQSVADFFNESGSHGSRKPSSTLVQLRKEQLESINRLNQSFQSAGLEVNYGRLPVHEAKPLVASIKRTNGWISCGMGLGTREGHEPSSTTTVTDTAPDSEMAPAEVHEEKLLESLQPCIFRLLETVNSSASIVIASIELMTRGSSPKNPRMDERWSSLYQVDCQEEAKKPSLTVLKQRHRMSEAVEAFKDDLAFVLKRLAASAATKGQEGVIQEKDELSLDPSCGPHHLGSGLFCSDIYDVAFLMVSLLEIAKEVAGDLITCQNMIAQWHAHESKRLWFPSVGLASWIRIKLSRESETGFVFHNDELDSVRRELLLPTKGDGVEGLEKKMDSSHLSFANWSHQSKIVRLRIKISKALAYLKHNVHIHYGLKLSGGAVLISLPAWLSEARSWFENERGVWLVVTYIWVLETSTGATIRVSIYRATATIAAAIWAFAAWYICDQGNRYGVGFFIILAELPASYFILYSRHARSLGLVFAFTQSVILFFPLTPGAAASHPSVVHLGLVRGYQILLGIAAAFIVNILVWPLHARVYLLRTISRVTAQCSTEYLSLARQMLNNGVIVGPETSKKFSKLEDNIQIELVACREYLEIMHVELSLIPKPINTLSLVLKTLQRVADLLVLLRKCREVALRIIQKESCFNVLNLRKELVSNLLLTFWIIGQSLVTKEPLPQFLPSCREALAELTEGMRQEIDSNSLHVRLFHNDKDRKEHTSTVPPLTSVFPSSSSRRRNKLTTSGQSTPRHQKVIDYSYFFVFAEHTLLSEIIFEVEKLLFLTKMLVGESSFIDSQYLPRHDFFDANIVDSQDLNAFHHSMSEHGIDGRRLISQLDAQLRAAKAEAVVAEVIRSEV